MDHKLNRLYEFGPFRLDATERLLLRDGEAVPLTPKAFELLLVLVGQPGHLLERDVLLKAVWPDTFVEENNLADNISRLRKALGEGENGQKFIETVPKRGYRFVAEVIKQDHLETEPVVERSASPGGNASADRNRSRVKLTFAAFLVLALVCTGAWLNFRVKKRAEIDRLEFKGMFYLSKFNEDEVRKGIEYYNQAVALDPNSASSYHGLATGWIFLSDLHVSPREAMPKAKAAAVKVLQLNEKSASAHVSMALIKAQYDWDWAGADKEFQRAITLDPELNLARQIHGWYLIALGRPNEAQAEMKRTVDADPLDDFGLWGLGLSFYFARQYEPAIEQYRRAIGVDPKSHWQHMLLGWAYEQEDKYTDAVAELNEASRLFNSNPQVLAALGHVYARSGRRAEAQKVIADLQETARRRYVSPYDVATIYAGLGDNEQALAWLEKAYEDRSGWLAWWLKVDPKFDMLRSDPRFHNLLQRTGLAR